MKAVIQRVLKASVSVGGETVGSCGEGFMVLFGAADGDTEADAELLARKTVNLRVFCDENGKMNLSLKDINGGVLCVSQFTLLADVKKGNRPSFTGAMEPQKACRLYDYFCEKLAEYGAADVQKGIFGADMEVSLVNNGPVTVLFDTKIWRNNGN